MKIIILLTLVTYNCAIEKGDYCSKSKDNTPCLYNCAKSSACGGNYVYTRLTYKEMKTVLGKHNELRNAVAGGRYKSKFLPAASDMMLMSWDKEAEFFAACYILECLFDHDKERYTLDGTYLGQNLYTRSSSGNWTFTLDIMVKGIQAWFDEIDLLTKDNAKPFFSSFESVKGAGHLTQLIWGASQGLGCVKMFNTRGKGFTWDLFCNYRPGGNVKRRIMYVPGKPSCKTNRKYTYLCGNYRYMKDDKYVSPIAAFGIDDRYDKQDELEGKALRICLEPKIVFIYVIILIIKVFV